MIRKFGREEQDKSRNPKPRESLWFICRKDAFARSIDGKIPGEGGDTQFRKEEGIHLIEIELRGHDVGQRYPG